MSSEEGGNIVQIFSWGNAKYFYLVTSFSPSLFHCSYKHAIDGLIRVGKEEGVKKLFNGVDWATGRAVGEE